MSYEVFDQPASTGKFHHPFEIDERIGNVRITICHNDIVAELLQTKWDTDWHFHSRCEIIALLAGKEQIVADRKYHMGANTICILPQQMKHKTSPLDPVQQKVSLLISIDPKSSRSKRSDFEEQLCQLFNNTVNGHSSPIFLPDRSDIIQNIRNAIETKQSGDLIAESSFRYHLILFVLQVMNAIWRRKNENFSENTGEDLIPDSVGIRNQMIESFLYNNAHRNFTIRELADYIHLSERQVSRILLKYYGTTFKQIVNHNRIQVSKSLLLRGESISRTAELVGFQSVTGFRKAFRAVTGESPNAFLKVNRKADGK